MGWAMKNLEMTVINLRTSQAITEDGQVLSIVAAFDDDGEDCQLEDASGCVAGPDAYGMFLTIDFREAEKVKMQ
jgi:hypothetical protein